MPTWLDRLLTWTGLRDPWSPGPAPNPFAVPTDPAAADRSVADPAASDPYHDGQWSPLLAPVPTNPAADQVRADAYVPPYTGPLDLDDYGRETDEMRRAYRDLHRTEPALRSAIDGKAAAVAALDVSVLPEDKDRPEDCRAAKFVDWTVTRSPHGWDGLILTILRPALIDGFSIGEKVLKGIDDSRQWHGFWGLKHVKGRDTAHLELRLDGYRNVLGVVNTVRGLRTFAPGKFVLFTHADLFDNPFGQSDLRAAYRAAGQIKDAYQLWYLALKRCGEPYLHGKYDHPAQRHEFEKALRSLRAGGWAVTGPKDEIAVLDLAGAASFDAFERKVRILREDIFLAVRGAYTPFMQSSSGAGEARGSAAVSQRGGSDPVEEVLARAVGRVLTDQLVPDLVRPNFGPGVGLPRVVLGGVNWGEMKARLDILERAKKLGLSVSARWAHETLQIPPAAHPDDELGGPPKGGPGPGRPVPPSPAAPAGEKPGGAGGRSRRAFSSEYVESEHPRDKNGEWMTKDAIAAARTDPAKAAELRQQVRPGDQHKLETQLAGTGPASPPAPAGPPPPPSPPTPTTPHPSWPTRRPDQEPVSRLTTPDQVRMWTDARRHQEVTRLLPKGWQDHQAALKKAGRAAGGADVRRARAAHLDALSSNDLYALLAHNAEQGRGKQIEDWAHAANEVLLNRLVGGALGPQKGWDGVTPEALLNYKLVTKKGATDNFGADDEVKVMDHRELTGDTRPFGRLAMVHSRHDPARNGIYLYPDFGGNTYTHNRDASRSGTPDGWPIRIVDQTRLEAGLADVPNLAAEVAAKVAKSPAWAAAHSAMNASRRAAREKVARGLKEKIGQAEAEGPEAAQGMRSALKDGISPEMAGAIVDRHLADDSKAAPAIAHGLSPGQALNVVAAHLDRNPAVAASELARLPVDVQAKVVAAMTGKPIEEARKLLAPGQ